MNINSLKNHLKSQHNACQKRMDNLMPHLKEDGMESPAIKAQYDYLSGYRNAIQDTELFLLEMGE